MDLIEVLNARTTFKRDLDRCRRLAEQTSIPPVAVSDAHTPGELGTAYVELDSFDGSPLSFKEAVRGAKLAGHRSTPLVHMVTAYVKLKKRVLPGPSNLGTGR